MTDYDRTYAYDEVITAACPTCNAESGERCTTGQRNYGKRFLHIRRKWVHRAVQRNGLIDV